MLLPSELMATHSGPTSAWPGARLADAAGAARWLADGASAGVALVPDAPAVRGRVDALAVPGHGDRPRAEERVAVGAGAGPGLADAACRSSGLRDRACAL